MLLPVLRRLIQLILLLGLLVYAAYIAYYFSDYRIRRESRLLWHSPLKVFGGNAMLRGTPEGRLYLLAIDGLECFDATQTRIWMSLPNSQPPLLAHRECFEAGPDGRLYCVDSYQDVQAVSAGKVGISYSLVCLGTDGQTQWRNDRAFANKVPGLQSLVLTATGYVLLALSSGETLVCDSNGRELGRPRITLNMQALPEQDNNQQLRLDGRGQLYYNEIGVGVTAYDIHGKQLWQYKDAGAGFGELTQAPDGTVYYANGKETVALSPEGKKLWSAKVPGGTWNPAPSFYLAPKQGLWVLGPGTSFYLLGLDGRQLVKGDFAFLSQRGPGLLQQLPFFGGGSSYTSYYGAGYDNLYGAAVGADGTFYLATEEQGLQAYSLSGRRLWHALLLEPLSTSPYLAPDGGLYLLGHSELAKVRK